MRKGFETLRTKQRYSLKSGDDVVLHFGKYEGMSFKQIAEEDGDYLQWLLDVNEYKLSDEVKSRLMKTLNETSRFWI